MRSLHAVGFALLTALLLGADEKEDAVKKEMAKFQGEWTVTSAELDGKTDETRKDGKIIFKGDTFSRKAKESVAGTFKLDPGTKPASMDVTFTEGPNKGKSMLEIYAFEGDTLKICAGPVGKERPKEFVSKEGTGNLLLVLKRVKPVAAKPAVPAFADKNLEAAVRAVLQDTKGELNDSNLINVYVLEAAGKGISNLKGLEKCKNLALLKLTNNQVTDLTPLKDLVNIQSLDLAGNKISDVTPLAGLTKIQYLELSNNQVSDVAPLKGISSLSALYLSNNKVSDIGPLGDLAKLSSLSLGRNQVKDLSALTRVTKLSTLDLNDNQVEDLSSLSKQTELSLLMLERNKITDLAPLVAMAKADAEGARRFAPYLRLYLRGNPLSENAKASQLAALKGFGVRVEF